MAIYVERNLLCHGQEMPFIQGERTTTKEVAQNIGVHAVNVFASHIYHELLSRRHPIIIFTSADEKNMNKTLSVVVSSF